MNGTGSAILNIGRDPVGAEYFIGLIDEPMAFNRALSPTEIQAIYNAGSSGMCGLGLVVSVGDSPSREDSFAFAAPWPNPAMRMAHVTFRLPSAAVVRADVFDVAGRRVASLIRGKRLAAGEHQAAWDGRSDSGRRGDAGIYQVRIATGEDAATRSVVWIGNWLAACPNDGGARATRAPFVVHAGCSHQSPARSGASRLAPIGTQVRRGAPDRRGDHCRWKAYRPRGGWA